MLLHPNSCWRRSTTTASIVRRPTAWCCPRYNSTSGSFSSATRSTCRTWTNMVRKHLRSFPQSFKSGCPVILVYLQYKLSWKSHVIWLSDFCGNPGAKTINVFRACLGAQLTICAQKWRNIVLFSTVRLTFVLSRVCVFLYSLGPRGQDYKRFSSMDWCSTHNLCSEMT